MLTEIELDELTQPIINIYSRIELELIKDVAARFDTYDTAGGSLAWHIQKLDELGTLNADMIKTIARYSRKSEKEILEMLNKAGLANIDFELLNKAHAADVIKVNPSRIKSSSAFASLIELTYKELDGTFRLIQTKALESARQAYMDIINRSYVEVAAGVYDYGTSIRRAVQRMAANGITGATYKRGGRIIRYSIESAVRRDTLTAVHKLANRASEKVCAELGAEYVEVSSHLGARVHPTNPIANHAGWQGKVYKINGRDEKYPNLKESTGYPDDILGLGGVNCRHRLFAFFPGISSPNPARFSEEENKKAYELSQRQRAYERKIRNIKRRQAAAKACGDKDAEKEFKRKFTAASQEYDAFCEANNLRRDYGRELVAEQITVTPLKAENKNVHYVGKIDKDIYRCVTDDIAADDVIITETQIRHIKERHPNDYESYFKYIKEVVENPDYILEANKPDTAFVLKHITENDKNFELILRLKTSKDEKDYKNSIITFLKIDEKRYNRYVRNKTILYKSE